MSRPTKKSTSRKQARKTPVRQSFFRRSRISWLALVVVFGLGAALYGYTLRFPFQFDGESYLQRNPLLKDPRCFLSLFDFSKIRGLIHDQQLPVDVGTNFILRPFSYLTFYLNLLIAGGWSEAGCRAVNIVIHCLNGFLVFKLLSQLLRHSPKSGDLRPSSSLFIPAVAAVLFTVHPLQTEAVTYIVQRFTSLGTLFYLLTLLLYFQAQATQGVNAARLLRVGSVLALIAGMLSKEEVFTAPLMMLLLDRVIMGTAWKTMLRRALPHLVCMAIIPALIMALAIADHSKNNVLLHAVSIANNLETWDYHRLYILTQIRVIVTYLGLLLVPHRLNVDWDYTSSTSLLEWQVLACGGLILALLAGGWFFYRSARHEVRHALAFCSLLWFFVTLSISSSIIPLPDMLAEHRVYLPSIGLMALLACGADLLRTQFFQNRLIARAVPAAIAVWVLGLCAATVVRNEVWRTGISLWSDAALKSPNKFRVWGNLGVCYGVEGRNEDARVCLEKALSLRPDYDMGYRNLAIILTSQQKYVESIRTSEQGLRVCGNDPMMYYNIAVAYCAMGRLNEGAAALQNVLALNPNHFLSHFSLGDIYVRLTKFDAAMHEYRIAAQLSPKDERLKARMEQIQSSTHPVAGF